MEVRLFGEVAIVDDDGAAHHVGAGRAAALIAVLALQAGRAVSVDRLVDLIWGDDTPGRPDHAVRVVVSRARAALRRAVGVDDLIVATRNAYRVDVRADQVDVLRFDHLVDAVTAASTDENVLAVADDAFALWRAEPLTDFVYDDIAIGVRRRLAERHADLVQAWAIVAARQGRASEVIERVEAELELHPYRERLWMAQATALELDGRHAEAISTMLRARELLAEAGLELSSDAADLERLIHARQLESVSDSRVDELPHPVDSLVGRDTELVELAAVLDTARLVTLTGAPGVGKTRLAIAAASTVADRFDVLGFVDLSAVADGGVVRDVVAGALGSIAVDGRGWGDAVRRRFGTQRVLVVIDNCEHVVDEVAPVVGDLLASTASVTVVATSREPLSMRGEHVIAVTPLTLPSPGDRGAAAGAVQLFAERATAVDPEFRLGEHLESVEEIVRRLDGLPLAIEIAAAATHVVPVEEIVRRLDGAVGTLSSVPRRGDPRHRTLEAALDWSYQLLSTDEQQVFRSLAAFRSTFDRAAAAAVCGEPVVVSALERLVATSLVTRSGRRSERFRLLEPIRQFAAELLSHAREEELVLDRQDGHAIAMLEQAGSDRTSPFDPVWRERVIADLPYLRLAVERVAAAGRASDVVGMCSVLCSFLTSAGNYVEADRLATLALTFGDGVGDEELNELIEHALWNAVLRGDFERGRKLAEEADRRAPDRPRVRNALGSMYASLGDLRRARRHLEEALEHAEPDSFPVTTNLAVVEAWSGRVHAAASIIEALHRRAPADPRAAASRLVTLGIAARMQGKLVDAVDLLEQARHDLVERGQRFHADLADVELAIALHELGDDDQARTYCDALLDPDRDVPRMVEARARLLRVELDASSGWSDRTGDELQIIAARGEQVGSVWMLAETLDLAALRAVNVGSDAEAAELLAAGDALRDDADLARDAWHEEQITSRFGARRERSSLPGVTVSRAGLAALLSRPDGAQSA